MRFRSMNPVIRHQSKMGAYEGEHAATYSGVISKSAFLLAITFMFGGLSMWRLMEHGVITGGIAVLIIAPIVAFISVIVAMYKPHLASYFSIVYAICQGTVLGVISGMYELVFQDQIVLTALVATFSVFAGMLFLFSTGLFRVSDMLRKVLFTALLGIIITSLFLMIFRLTGVFTFEQMEGLIFAIVIISVIVASLFLMVDFDRIQQSVQAGVEKHYEWVLSLGLLVTLVWLYIELLRLIALLRNRR